MAKKVVEAIHQRHGSVLIDCHPANGYTGLLQVFRLEDSRKKQLFSGNKEEVEAKLKDIVATVEP